PRQQPRQGPSLRVRRHDPRQRPRISPLEPRDRHAQLRSLLAQPPGAPATNYAVLKNGAQVALVGGTNTTFTLNGLTNGVTVSLQVAALAGTPGDPSNSLTVTPTLNAPPLPGAVSGLAAVPRDGGALLTWVANPETSLAGYYVYRGAVPGFDLGQPVANLSWSSISYADAGIPNAQPAYYRLVAYDSSFHNASPRAQDAVLSLRWILPAWDGRNPITQLNLYRGTSLNWTLLTTLPPTATTYQDAPLLNGVTYTYRLAAQNAQGEGGFAWLNATPARVPYA